MFIKWQNMVLKLTSALTVMVTVQTQTHDKLHRSQYTQIRVHETKETGINWMTVSVFWLYMMVWFYKMLPWGKLGSTVDISQLSLTAACET